jgi:predicted amidohydrolase YtcJ
MKNAAQWLSIALSLTLMNCTEQEQADLIVHNAKIYTVNDAFDVNEAMVIANGKIVAIGAEHEILNKYSAKEVIDVRKRPIYPGFIDAHCHFLGYGFGKEKVDLVGTSSFEEVIDRVLTFNKEKNPEWIIGRGWDQNDWEVKEFPTKEKLDSLFPTTPVVLTRIDGHAALVNSEVLRRSAINYQTEIEGGAILQYSSSENNGIE